MFFWCRRPDSNRHTRRRLILNQLRLPIPPLRHEVMCFLGNAVIILALRTLATFILKIQIVRLKKKHNETINTKKNEIAFVVYLSIDDYVKFFTTILSPFPLG